MKTKTNAAESIRAQMGKLNDREMEISAKAAEEGRALTAEEKKELDDISAKFEALDADLSRLEKIDARAELLDKPAARVTSPAPVQASGEKDTEEPARLHVTGGAPAGSKPSTWGWRTFGEFTRAVKHAAVNPGQMDGRLMAAATTYGNEGTQQDGGFAVPPDFRADIVKKVQAEDSLLARTDQQYTSSNRVTVPQDNTTPWQTSGGIQAFWDDEAATLTQSKPALEAMEVKLNKLTALVPVTDEMLEDVPLMSRYLPGKVGDKFTSKLNDVIVNGNGVAKAKGLMNSGSKVTVSKESGQATATINYTNIVKMWARLYAPLRAGAVWLCNQDIEPQLLSMTVPGTQPAFPAYMPPNGLSAAPYGTLLGRPIIAVETCETLGTEGDLILTNLGSYLTLQKVGGVRSDVSMHVYFDQGMTAFRFTMRMGGQSWWNAAITRQKGSNTLSNIVTLATRS